jgi:hypothetical protein
MRVETDKFIMEWAIPDRVIQITYRASLERDDLIYIAQELETFYEAGTAPVHVISDSTDMGDIDANLDTLRETFEILTQDKWGWLMIIGTNPLLNFFATLLGRAFGLNIRRADSPDEALESLRRLDQTLPIDNKS